jgi:hypothetical protein
VRLILRVSVEEIVDCNNELESIRNGKNEFINFLRTRYDTPLVHLHSKQSFSSPYFEDEISPYKDMEV